MRRVGIYYPALDIRAVMCHTPVIIDMSFRTQRTNSVCYDVLSPPNILQPPNKLEDIKNVHASMF